MEGRSEVGVRLYIQVMLQWLLTAYVSAFILLNFFLILFFFHLFNVYILEVDHLILCSIYACNISFSSLSLSLSLCPLSVTAVSYIIVCAWCDWLPYSIPSLVSWGKWCLPHGTPARLTSFPHECFNPTVTRSLSSLSPSHFLPHHVILHTCLN